MDDLVLSALWYPNIWWGIISIKIINKFHKNYVTNHPVTLKSILKIEIMLPNNTIHDLGVPIFPKCMLAHHAHWQNNTLPLCIRCPQPFCSHSTLPHLVFSVLQSDSKGLLWFGSVCSSLFLFFIFHMSEVIWHLSLSFWFTEFSIISSSSTHIATKMARFYL